MGIEYYLDLFGDEGQIDSGIFNSKAEKRYIFSMHYGGCLNFYRVYDTLILDFETGGNDNFHNVAIIDCRTDAVIMTFESVYIDIDFFAGTGSYDFKILSIADYATHVMHVDEYIITQSGVHKTNF